ncbi:DUF6412 domain-containing protein [Micromonospora sp. WMMD558]|uniref:DUF6412 domain-containing protein n=1 Tax=unclassified Micromonospora TaxID=2617518 RepID=UPI001E28C9B7|nr:DUF6412 domain-containing protein [Micromonospora sp. WMMC415]
MTGRASTSRPGWAGTSTYARGVLLGWWAVTLAGLTVVVDHPSGLLAGAALVLLATLLAVRIVAVPAAGATRAVCALRARARARRVPRQVDPDASGRPRPRAPGVLPSAA